MREGLGMSIELGAATLGVDAADLERWEGDPATPAWQIAELLGAYAVHMAAMWGFTQLRLNAQNFEDIRRIPAASSAQRSTACRPISAPSASFRDTSRSR